MATAYVYSLQVITKKGTDPEKARSYFINKTGKVPQIYENGTRTTWSTCC